MLALPDKLKGQKVRCKHCQKVLRVPTEVNEASSVKMPVSNPELLVQGSRPCPGCGQVYAPAIRVCVGCGVDIDAGAMLYASLEESGGSGVHNKPEAKAPWFQRLLKRLGLVIDEDDLR